MAPSFTSEWVTIERRHVDRFATARAGPQSTWNDGFVCPATIPSLPHLKWGYAAYCPSGSATPTVCPAGHFCPDPTAALPCPPGRWCPVGANASIPCAADLFGAAPPEQRCRGGSSSSYEPSRREHLVWLMAMSGILFGACEAVSIFERRRRGLPFSAPSPAPGLAHSASHGVVVLPPQPTANLGLDVRKVDDGSPGNAEGSVFTNVELRDLHFHIGSAHVLKDLSANMHQGELVALMGESGSGKTTLLNILGGRASYGVQSGGMFLNGKRFNAHHCRHLIGYVPQAHLVFKELTVYENLIYAAELRLPRSITPQAREQLVEMALDLLGLQEVSETLTSASEHAHIPKSPALQLTRVVRCVIDMRAVSSLYL